MSQIIESFISIRQQSEHLCKPLLIEDYIPQAADFVSPPKWHLAHTSWFFETMILQNHAPQYTPFHKDFHFLFNSYYQTMGRMATRAERGIITRPTVEQVYAYRQHVDTQIIKLLQSPKQHSQKLVKLVTLGLNHEQQHQELLLMDLKYTFSFNPTFPCYDPQKNLVSDINQRQGWQYTPSGNYTVGHNGKGFCFDNELSKHKVHLNDFNINQALVTNGEFMDFIDDGGYDDFSYWLDEGWIWREKNHISHPLYWHKIDNQWQHYTLAGLKNMNHNQILAHISYYEADAYARWKGCRLPTEFEWEVASSELDWGKRWEWTSSAYQAYPNFTIDSGAVGEYNGKFMINQIVLRGASTATPKGHSRTTYRNFFHPHMQWQFSGIRLAK